MTCSVLSRHLGYCHKAFLPNNRGFHYFFGQYSHVTDYYNRRVKYDQFGREQEASDLHENSKPSKEGAGEFSPDLYTR